MKTFGIQFCSDMIYLEETPQIGCIPGCISINFRNLSCPYRSWLGSSIASAASFSHGPPWHPSLQTCHQTSGTAAQTKPAARHDVESGKITLHWKQRRILTRCRAPWNSVCGSPRSCSRWFVRQFHGQESKTPAPHRTHCSWHRMPLEKIYRI